MIYPMFLMVLLTLGYGGYMAYGRFQAAKSGEINVRYFKTMSGYDVTDNVRLATRHFANLLETPPLFYIAGALIIAMGLESAFTIFIGWVYLLCRIAHTYIHNTYNNPLHRLIAFVCSLVCVLILWFALVINL